MNPCSINRRTFLGGMAAAAIAPAAFMPSVFASETFTVGEGKIITLSDGTFAFPPDLFTGATDEQKKNLGNPVVFGANAFALRRGEKLFLFDAGAGNGPFITSQFGSVGRLPSELDAAGIDPAQVTDVVITHLHPDHIGGVIYDKKRTFPNATIHVNATEWGFWTRAGFAEDAPEGMRAMVGAIQKTAREIEEVVSLHKGNTDLGGGVQMQFAPGHTPGHSVMLLDLGSEQVLILGDVAVSDHIHFAHPSVGWALDVDPAQAQATRRRLFDMAVTDNLIVAGNHVSAPGLGRIERAGDAYRFVGL